MRFRARISTVLELQILLSSWMEDSTIHGMLEHKNINDDQKKVPTRPKPSIFAHKHGSHAHARADAHARHEDSLVCLPSDV